MNKNKLFASVIGLLVFVAGLSAKDYQVAMFGIKSDGVTLNTRSIQRAVDYISEQGGGRLIFYVGRYLTGSITRARSSVRHTSRRSSAHEALHRMAS